MSKTLIISTMASLLFALNAKAQTAILNDAIQHINKYKHITYTQVTKQVGPFNDDATILTIKSAISNSFDNAGKRVELYNQDEARGFKNVYNGSTKFSIDLKNKTYRILDSSDSEPYHSPFYWADFMQDNLSKSPEKVKILPDTIISNTACYHIKFLLDINPTGHTIYDICLNKINYLPIYTKVDLMGKFGKGDFTGEGIHTMVDENTYSNYVINPNKFPDITAINIPLGFNIEKRPIPLSAGQKAPDWNLQDAHGYMFSSSELRGKVILIDFSFIACAACGLSLPALNHLHERYNGTDVKIISINPDDKKESILKFIKNNKIKYPVLTNGESTSKKFQVAGYPNFYVIDKQGNIAKYIDGYSEDLEKLLITEIDKLK